MYAIVKTGGKQYKVAPGDKLNVEKLPGEVGDKVALEAICTVDGKKVEAKPDAAAKTKVEAVIVEQFRADKILVFKFKKRKNYKRLQGHRQDMTRIQILAVGSDKYEEPKAAKKKAQAKKEEASAKADDAKKEDAAAKKPAAKAAEKTASKSSAKAADKADKPAKADKAAAEKTDTKAKSSSAKKAESKKDDAADSKKASEE